MRRLLIPFCFLVGSLCCVAQDPGTPAPDTSRPLGVIPANRIASQPKQEPMPLTVGGKFKLATRDSIDPFTFVVSGFYAGIGQWQNDFPGFGLGAAGFGKRYGAAYADQVVENYMTEAVFPSLLHQDPRFYRKGTGGWRSRLAYALTRTMITRTDEGQSTINFSEIGGVAAGAAISTAYYPAADRNAREAAERFGIQIVSDSGFNVLLEFWPDIRHAIFHKK